MTVSTDKILQRYRTLIHRGRELRKKSKGLGPHSPITSWMLSAENLLQQTIQDPHLEEFGYQRGLYGDNSPGLGTCLAVLQSAAEEIREGFVKDIQQVIEADLHEDVLEQASHLLSRGYKDLAAMLCRVVIERSLKSTAQRHGIDPSQKLTALNDALWKAEVYNKSHWRVTQGYIDMGNDAAHGQFDKYDDDLVGKAIEWIRERMVAD